MSTADRAIRELRGGTSYGDRQIFCGSGLPSPAVLGRAEHHPRPKPCTSAAKVCGAVGRDLDCGAAAASRRAGATFRSAADDPADRQGDDWRTEIAAADQQSLWHDPP